MVLRKIAITIVMNTAARPTMCGKMLNAPASANFVVLKVQQFQRHFLPQQLTKKTTLITSNCLDFDTTK